MSFTGSFSISQTAPNIIVMTDGSSGSDPNLTGRHITFIRADGSKLVLPGTNTSYVDFPLSSGPTITLDILDRDYALQILVEWLSSSPIPGGNYSSQSPYVFTWWTYQFLYGLTQERQVAMPNIVKSGNYVWNKAKMWSEVLGAKNALNLGLDIVNAQQALNSAYKMIQKPQLYF